MPHKRQHKEKQQRCRRTNTGTSETMHVALGGAQVQQGSRVHESMTL